MIQGLKMSYSERFFKVNRFGEILNSNGVVVDLTKYSPPIDLIEKKESEIVESSEKKKKKK